MTRHDRGVSKATLLVALGLITVGIVLTLFDNSVGLVVTVVGFGLFVSLSTHRTNMKRIR